MWIIIITCLACQPIDLNISPQQILKKKESRTARLLPIRCCSLAYDGFKKDTKIFSPSTRVKHVLKTNSVQSVLHSHTWSGRTSPIGKSAVLFTGHMQMTAFDQSKLSRASKSLFQRSLSSSYVRWVAIEINRSQCNRNPFLVSLPHLRLMSTFSRALRCDYEFSLSSVVSQCNGRKCVKRRITFKATFFPLCVCSVHTSTCHLWWKKGK